MCSHDDDIVVVAFVFMFVVSPRHFAKDCKYTFLGSQPDNFYAGSYLSFHLNKERSPCIFPFIFVIRRRNSCTSSSSIVFFYFAHDRLCCFVRLRISSPNGVHRILRVLFELEREIYLLLFNLAFQLIFQRIRKAMLVFVRANHRDLVFSSLIPSSFDHLGIALFLPLDSRYFPCIITPVPLKLQSYCAFYNICVSYRFIIDSIILKRSIVLLKCQKLHPFFN